MHDDVAWYFEQEVTNEEDTGAEAVNGFAELQVVQHAELGEAHVDAIKVSRNVAKEEEWQQAQRNFCVNAVLQLGTIAGGSA